MKRSIIAFDPKSGSVYQTEDQHNGMIYRFLPNDKTDLKKGGKLQGLAFINGVQDTRNWKDQIIKKNQSYQIKWIDIDNVESPNDNLRYQGYEKGCARFARPEGLWEHNGEVFYTCTSGGKKELGQIWKYIPSPYEGTSNESEAPGKLELFF